MGIEPIDRAVLLLALREEGFCFALHEGSAHRESPTRVAGVRAVPGYRPWPLAYFCSATG